MAMKMIQPAVVTKITIVERYAASASRIKYWNRISTQNLSFGTRQFTSLNPSPTSKAASSSKLPLQAQSIICSSQAISRLCARLSRDYSTDNTTIQGSVDKGLSGVEDRAWAEPPQAPEYLNEKERMIFEKLREELEPIKLEVQDISGGCGSMYGIEIVSERFRGLSILAQQRLVNQVLGKEIKGWHGVQLKTRAP